MSEAIWKNMPDAEGWWWVKKPCVYPMVVCVRHHGDGFFAFWPSGEYLKIKDAEGTFWSGPLTPPKP